MGWIILGVLALGLIWVIGVTVEFVVGFAGVFWRQVHYVRHGRCPEKRCHLKGSWVKYQTDNIYGAYAKNLICPVHGDVATSGDRRAVNW